MTQQQREFYAFFQKEFEDRIITMCLSRLKFAEQEFIKVGLELPAGRKDLWGLLIAGENAIHFYAHASEGSMAAMFRSASGGRVPTVQHVTIPHDRLKNIITSETKKGFWNRLFAQDISVSLVFLTVEGIETRLNVVIPDSGTELITFLKDKSAAIGEKNHKQ